MRECARLQSFPDWFEIKNKYTTGGSRRKIECPRYTQVGNAVPPLLGEALGRALAEWVLTQGTIKAQAIINDSEPVLFSENEPAMGLDASICEVVC